MQAFGEGFDILERPHLEKLPEGERFDLNLADVAEVWRPRQRDFIRGCLISPPSAGWRRTRSSKNSPASSTTSAASRLDHSSEQIEQAVPASVLTAALYTRFRSRTGNNFGRKDSSSAQRKGFGGHVEAEINAPPSISSAQAPVCASPSLSKGSDSSTIRKTSRHHPHPSSAAFGVSVRRWLLHDRRTARHDENGIWPECPPEMPSLIVLSVISAASAVLAASASATNARHTSPSGPGVRKINPAFRHDTRYPIAERRRRTKTAARNRGRSRHHDESWQRSLSTNDRIPVIERYARPLPA